MIFECGNCGYEVESGPETMMTPCPRCQASTAEWPVDIDPHSELYGTGPNGEINNGISGLVVPYELAKELYDAIIEDGSFPDGSGITPRLKAVLRRWREEVKDIDNKE